MGTLVACRRAARWYNAARVLFSVLLALSTGSCSGDGAQAPLGPEAMQAKKDTNPVALNAPGTVEMTPADTTLKVGQSQVLTAVVKNAAGNVVPNQPVTFSSSAPQVATVDEGGTVSAMAEGTATITGTRNNRSGDARVQVLRWGTTVALLGDELLARAGEPVTVVATLTREDGAVLAGEPIWFLVDGENVVLLETDADGRVTTELTELAVGRHAFSAHYDGSVANAPSFAEGAATIRKWTTTLAADDVEADDDGNTTLIATLTREDEAPLPGATVTFTLNGEVVGSDATDGEGVATFDVTGLIAGVIPYGAAFEGDDAHEPSSGTASVDAGPWPTTLVADDVEAVPVGSSRRATLRATLTRADGQGVEGVLVRFYAPPLPSGRFVIGRTDADGVATATVSGFTYGKVTYTASFLGDAGHVASSDQGVVDGGKWPTAITATDLYSSSPNVVVSAWLKNAAGVGVPGKPVVVEIGDETLNLTTLSGPSAGMIKFQIGNFTDPVATVTYTFAGDDDYLPSTGSALVDAVPWETTLTANNVTAAVNGVATLGGRLTRADGMAYGGKRVYFVVEGRGTVGADYTDSQGSVSLNVSGFLAGVTSYMLLFQRDATLDAAVGHGQVDGGGWPTRMTVDDVVAVDGIAELAARLTRTTGGAVEGAILDFAIQGTPVGSAPTDDDGWARLPVPLDGGLLPYQVTFAGNEENEPSSGSGMVDGGRAATQMDVAPASGVYGEFSTFEATLRDIGGAPLAGMRVDFSLPGKGVVASEVTTADGTAQASVKIPLPEGAHEVTASFGGNAYFTASTATAPLVVTKGTSAVSIGVGKAWTGQPTTLSIQVTDAFGAVTAAKTLEVTIDGALAWRGVTPTGTVYPYQTTLSAGEHSVDVTYLEDDYRTGSQASTTVEVVPVPTVVRVNALTPKHAGQPFSVTGNAFAQNGDPLLVPPIAVFVDDDPTPVGHALYNRITREFRYDFPTGLPAGTRRITVRYPGSGSMYAPSEGSVTVTITGE